MKSYITILFVILLSNNIMSQNNNYTPNYQKGINYMFKELNNFRTNTKVMDSICLVDAKKNHLTYTRKSSQDSIFPFILNKKLCDEALKRCKYNIKQKKDVFKASHLYDAFECQESIHATRTSIRQFNIEEDLKNAIISLIVDCEPVIGHREMLLTTDIKYKHIGFAYIIITEGDRIDLLIIVLTSSQKGLNNPINFNNTYIDQSKCIIVHRKDLLKKQ